MFKNSLSELDRQKIVANTLGNLRIENINPSDELRSGLEAYVVGEKTTADLQNDLKSKYAFLKISK